MMRTVLATVALLITFESGAQTPTSPRSVAETYCANIADKAADARFFAQKKQIEELQKQLNERAAALDAKIAEYRKWVQRRDEFAKRAEEQLVQIYARMRPDAAALQLAAMDEETAAALITRLKMRNASAILNEMPPDKAARLSGIIAGAATGPNRARPEGGS
jgi:flagellar motility protein MotE (MotC chaperone)